jgi:23S rRNA pseudouridine1911/1915/1917 synthase
MAPKNPADSPALVFTAEAEAGERLDHALVDRLPELTRSAIQRLIDEGHIQVDGRPVKSGHKLRPGERVRVVIPPARPTDLTPEPIPLDILFEDADLLVLNKTRGLVVHPAPGHGSGTLVHAVLAHAGDELSGIGGEERPGIVHRLDRDTSGLMVVAKSDRAHESLQRQIQSRTAERRYLAVVRGAPKFERAEVDACIGRHPVDRKRMAVLPSSARPAPRPALTELRVLERFPGFALLEARLQTGRTHQIRVHCAYIGHPVIGDPLYGPRLRDPHIPPAVRRAIDSLQGQALHAYSLSFDHPVSGERLTFTAPPPADMQAVLDALDSRFHAAAGIMAETGRRRDDDKN